MTWLRTYKRKTTYCEAPLQAYIQLAENEISEERKGKKEQKLIEYNQTYSQY